MAYLLHQLIEAAAQRDGQATALLHRDRHWCYAELDDAVRRVADGLQALGATSDARVAVYLPKQFETVAALFGAMAAGGVAVPVNPLLKAEQVGHILRDCAAQVLVTSADRAVTLDATLGDCPALRHLVLVDDGPAPATTPATLTWDDLISPSSPGATQRIDADIGAILYTSGSTGRPKGVVLSHRNLLAGAHSVADYLGNTAADRLLAVLPLSFDYGLSQLTTAFLVGASVVLMDYLLPRDVIRAVERYAVTGLAAVPPLWNQLATLPWPATAVAGLRYVTNSGGSMPVATTQGLRKALPHTRIFLMYGLTEAFRSTFLAPEQLDHRPDSIGRAIPNAEVLVVRPDGSECDVDEPGELVHRGALVAQGYWGDPELSARRFRAAPGRPDGLPQAERAVWSGDRVRRDAEGYLYFLGRDDDMIKTSGYRVGPQEIEEVVQGLSGVRQVAAFGVPHPQLGQAIVVVAETDEAGPAEADIIEHCRVHLPAYMLPARVSTARVLPRTPNGKLDRRALAADYAGSFTTPEEP